MTIVNAIECLLCCDVVYSRARNDFRSCTCERISVDGGFDYTKVSGDLDKLKSRRLKIRQTKKTLYKDYITKTDKYGLISGVK